jgi:uncharacterized C2H2 Zn-finger protein
MNDNGYGWEIPKETLEHDMKVPTYGLEGKNLSKKGAYEYPSEINMEELYGEKEDVVYDEKGLAEKKGAEEIKCEACQKSFTVQASLKRHLERSTVCVNWNNLPQKIDGAKLTKGIHLLIDELLEKAIGNNGELECKYCKMKFTTKGNHHKHFNTATVCNRLAFQEFKTLFNTL